MIMRMLFSYLSSFPLCPYPLSFTTKLLQISKDIGKNLTTGILVLIMKKKMKSAFVEWWNNIRQRGVGERNARRNIIEEIVAWVSVTSLKANIWRSRISEAKLFNFRGYSLSVKLQTLKEKSKDEVVKSLCFLKTDIGLVRYLIMDITR